MIAVAGDAGSGKSTLGRALGAHLGAPVLDLDTLTNPLLDAVPESVWGGHWLSSPYAESIRDGRYAALRSTARQLLETTPRLVLVAPFTAELSGGAAWRQLGDAVGKAELTVVHLSGDAELLSARRAARGEDRDKHRPAPPAPTAPQIDVVSVDAELTTAQQLARVLPHVLDRLPITPNAPVFSSRFDAVLFDLDGTLIDSTASVLRSWRRFATSYGVSMDAVAENHGQPARALISRLLPPELHAEGLQRITQIEVADAVGLPPVLGAREFFDSIPAHQRGIVTSGSLAIASARVRAGGFDTPAVFITADDIRQGKPHPEPYLLAAARLGVDPRRCLVAEDAPAGIASAKAAGCTVVAVSGTVPLEELVAADLVVDGFDRLTVAPQADGALSLRLAE
ncbi:HAD-IA family hydrolase [Microbacterium sp. C23T]